MRLLADKALLRNPQVRGRWYSHRRDVDEMARVSEKREFAKVLSMVMYNSTSLYTTTIVASVENGSINSLMAAAVAHSEWRLN